MMSEFSPKRNLDQLQLQQEIKINRDLGLNAINTFNLLGDQRSPLNYLLPITETVSLHSQTGEFWVNGKKSDERLNFLDNVLFLKLYSQNNPVDIDQFRHLRIDFIQAKKNTPKQEAVLFHVTINQLRDSINSVLRNPRGKEIVKTQHSFGHTLNLPQRDLNLAKQTYDDFRFQHSQYYSQTDQQRLSFFQNQNHKLSQFLGKINNLDQIDQRGVGLFIRDGVRVYLDRHTHEIHGTHSIYLKQKEFDYLTFLMASMGQSMKPYQLERIYQNKLGDFYFEVKSQTNSSRTCVFSLKDKLDLAHPGLSGLIQSRHSFGYRFNIEDSGLLG